MVVPTKRRDRPGVAGVSELDNLDIGGRCSWGFDGPRVFVGIREAPAGDAVNCCCARLDALDIGGRCSWSFDGRGIHLEIGGAHSGDCEK